MRPAHEDDLATDDCEMEVEDDIASVTEKQSARTTVDELPADTDVVSIS